MVTELRRAIVVSLLVCVGATLQVSLGAQQAGAHLTHIRILTAGGLLGQDDGMPEYPGGSFDIEVGSGMHPYGGLAGLVDWLNRDKKRTDATPHDLFLMTANNLPREVTVDGTASSVDAFFGRVRELQPSAIAVGTEDFLRGLDSKRAGGQDRKRTGGLLVTRMRGSNLPFLVSNAVVRLHGPRLNRVVDRGFTLLIDRGSSIGWVEELSLAYPCGQRQTLKTGDVTLTRLKASPTPGDRPTRTPSVSVPEKGPCRARIALGSRLQPGSEYALAISAGSASIASFTFRTDEALTTKTAIVPDRPELPIVIALVDPHVRQILAGAKWRWHNEEGAACAAYECEILLLKPIEAFDTVLSLADPASSGRPVALLSQLEDKDTSALLQHSQRVRFVVLPPDSLALGRAAARTDTSSRAPARGARYSGDLGYGAVLNMSTPTAAQIWSRPEWFAETIHEVEADVDPGTWAFMNPTHAEYSVKGRALCARAAGPGGEVQYFLQDWDLVNGATVYRNPSPLVVARAPYRYAELKPGLAYDTAGRFAQGTLWTNMDSFAAVALDAMRIRFNTDLALLPDAAIDSGWLAYLRDDPHAPTQWLSRALLERLLFRAGTIVKVRVSADKVLDSINRMVSAARAAGVKYCVSGLGAVACGSPSLSVDRALINERPLDKNRFYTVALPESVALENGLQQYGSDEDDLVYAMDRLFARSTQDAVDTCAATSSNAIAGDQPGPAAEKLDPLAARIERVRATANSPYIFIKPAEFSFSSTQVDEPAAGLGLFNKLPIQNNGAKPSRRSSVSLAIDIGIVDKTRWALRAIGTIAYGRALVNGQSSTDPNTSLAALRLDRKMLPGRRFAGRLFSGVFWESQFSDQVTNVTASSKGVAGPTLPLVTQRRDYRFLSGGFELENSQYAKWLRLEPLRVSAAIGASTHEHVDIRIDGQPQGLLALQQLGATGLLNRYYASHPELSIASIYAFEDRVLRRARVQIECTPRFKIPLGGGKVDVALATTYRRFVGPNAMPLAERQSATFRLTIGVPLYGLATLNVNANQTMTQVNGIPGWFRVWQPSVSLSVPIISSRHAGWIW